MKNFSLQIILAAIQVDPILSILVVLSVGIILISFVFRLLKQPYVIAYILEQEVFHIWDICNK